MLFRSHGSARSRAGGLSWPGVADQLEAIHCLALQIVELDDSHEVELRVALSQLLELAELIAAGLHQLGKATTASAHALQQQRLQVLGKQLEQCQQLLQASHTELLGQALDQAAQPELTLSDPVRFPTW